MFSKRAPGKAVLVADVDDASVGISFVELAKDAPATVVAAERTSLPIEERTSDQSATRIIQLFKESLEKGLKSRSEPPVAAHIILRAPWTRFRTVEASEAFEAPRTITKDMIPTIAAKALAQPSELDHSNIIESGVMRVSLNGYPTAKPVGKKARLISVTAFEGDVNAELKRGIGEALAALLPARPVTYRSGMRALLTVLYEHIPDIHRYVIVDVGGSATNCAIVRREAVTQFGATPEGASSIVKKVAGTSVPEETLTHLRMLATDNCSTDACKAVVNALARAEPELAKTYGEMFATLAGRRRLPNNCMLSAPSELAPWLQGFFSRIDFAQFTASMQPFDVEALTPDHLTESIVWKAGAADTGLATAAGCVNILAGND